MTDMRAHRRLDAANANTLELKLRVEQLEREVQDLLQVCAGLADAVKYASLGDVETSDDKRKSAETRLLRILSKHVGRIDPFAEPEVT